MKKILIITIMAIFTVMLLPAQVITVADSDSPTGYTSTFLYKDDAATDVRLIGSFQFYENNDYHMFARGLLLSTEDSTNNYLIQPEDWTADKDLRHVNDEGYVSYMNKTADGWTISLQLPCASYMYYYSVSYDGGETWNVVSDPENLPPQNSWSMNPQYRSQFFVPYDATKQNPADDWTWILPTEDENLRGTIEYKEYVGLNGEVRPAQIYLPASYDANRAEPYKVIYMSHGTGGFEGDWFHQGNVPNIADNVFAKGKNEPFIIVSMENNGLIASNNFPLYDELHSDLVDCLIPFIEENYNVVKNASGRAFLGLSRGGFITGELLLRNPEDFAYFAPLSGGAAYALTDEIDIEAVKKADIYLGAGFVDHLLFSAIRAKGDASTRAFALALDAAGITYNNGNSFVIVPGAHDWFTWPQLVKDYFENVLWK